MYFGRLGRGRYYYTIRKSACSLGLSIPRLAALAPATVASHSR